MLRDSTTLARIIQSYAKTNQLTKGKQLHAHLIRTLYKPCIFVSNHLLNMYTKCGQLNYARNLFDKMPQRNIVSWTAMVSGFSQNGLFTDAISFFSMMRVAGENPTQFALSNVIQASASLRALEFDEVSWTSLIDGYTKNGNFEEALLAFRKMVCEGVNVDQHVFCSTLGACAGKMASAFGRSLHSLIVKLGFEVEVFVGNALTDMYSKFGDMQSASCVFNGDSEFRNVISCTSLIDGFVEKDDIENALIVFLELKRLRIEPNEFTFSSLIKACANQAALEQGTQLHAQAIKSHLEKDPFVSSVLVDMYGKCGLLDSSIHIFDKIVDPNAIAWNSFMGVFAQHGMGKDTVRVFDQMICRGVRPNEITFVNLLRGCSHSGMVEEGLNYFNSMTKVYGIEPRPEHYSCVIDLLGRAGRLKEAEEFINKMQFEPNAFGWCSFLGACRIYGDKGRGQLAAEKLMKLEPENSGTHVLLSNIYASAGQWEDVRSLRKLMKENNVKKLTGYSWVDFGNKIHVFEAADSCHPQNKEIYEKLENLLDQIREAGYVAQTELVPYDMEESQKERALHHHSERIAISFALISMPAEKPIIVKKNLRVCADCHSAIKFISKVVQRKIIVRDNSRFHHFEDGLCSCQDFW